MATGAKPETANRVLDVIHKYVDKQGVWEISSAASKIADEAKLSPATATSYLGILSREGVIFMGKTRRRGRVGGGMIDKVVLLKPNHRLVRDGKLLVAVEQK